MQASTRIITGRFNHIKNSGRLKVFEIQTDIEGLTGSIYVDLTVPLFDKLILSKGATITDIEVNNGHTKF